MTKLGDAVYGLTAWQDIINDDSCFREVVGQSMTCDERGVWVRDVGEPSLNWHPLNELDDPIARDPRQNPHLPFHFSATQLAAFMVDGVGYFLRERFGELGADADEDVLAAFPPEATTAKHAVRAAFQALREAIEVVGKLDVTSEVQVRELSAHQDAARREARASLGLDGMAQSDKYRSAVEATRLARKAAIAAEAAWRKKVVQHLLRVEGVGVTCSTQPRRKEKASTTQDNSIIQALKDKGIDPLQMPKAPQGNKPWPLRVELGQILGYSDATMKKAFTRLRNEGRMKDA